MNLRLIILLCLFPTISIAQLAEVNDIIRDPAISRRCKALLNERSEKIIVQQKLTSLIMRNKKLQNKSLESQKVVLGKLELLETRLKNNLRLTKLRVSSMEESLVRKGCPGITL
jgi:hypothetical protein